MNLAEIADNIKHRYLELTTDEPSVDTPHDRPKVSIWASADDDIPRVIVSLDSLWAQPTRYLDLSPEEARRLAGFLNVTADAVEQAAKDNGVV